MKGILINFGAKNLFNTMVKRVNNNSKTSWVQKNNQWLKGVNDYTSIIICKYTDLIEWG